MKNTTLQKIGTIYGREVSALSKLKLPKDKKAWEEKMNLDLMDYCDLIVSFPYRSDCLAGLVDTLDSPDRFFIENKKSQRDCDDFARMYTLWAIYHGYSATEYLIFNNQKSLFKTLKKSHYVSVLKIDEKYYLANYEIYGPYATMQEALTPLKRTRKNMVTCELHTWTHKDLLRHK